MSWVVVPNWPKFQHYRDRQPPWIKLYTELQNRDEWLHLTLAARGLLVSVWLEYAARDGLLRTSDIPSAVAQKIPRRTFDSLVQAGFVRVRASKPLALARTRALAREAETEKEPPKSPKKTRRRTTGWRLVRGSHGITYVPDPNGTDKPPAEARL